MAINFEELLDRPLAEFKAPPLLPAGPYRMRTGVAADFGKSRDKETPFFEVTCQVVEALDGVDPDALAGIDLSKKTQRLTFYLTEDAMIRLKNFATACGVENLDNKSTKEVCGDLKNNKYEFCGYITHTPNKKAVGPDDPKFFANCDRFAKL